MNQHKSVPLCELLLRKHFRESIFDRIEAVNLRGEILGIR